MKLMKLVTMNNNIIYNTTSNEIYDIKSDTTIYTFLFDTSANITINLYENASITLNVSTINIKDNDIVIKVNHLEKNTKSNIKVTGLNTTNKKLKFDITGIIPKNVTGCTCKEDNRIINLSDGISMIIPKLLIDNNDTISTHSAYIGGIKESEIFYLMSRGISKKTASNMILESLLINDANKDEEIVNSFLNKLKEESWTKKQEEE